MINRHGLAILDQPYTTYTSNFKEQALKRIIVDHEPPYHVALALGLKSFGMLYNWLREYRKNGYNIVNKQRGRPPHDQKRTTDQTGKSATQARNQMSSKNNVLRCHTCGKELKGQYTVYFYTYYEDKDNNCYWSYECLIDDLSWNTIKAAELESEIITDDIIEQA